MTDSTTLYTETTLRASLGDVSERKFKELRAAGIIPDPLMLGPRCARWTDEDRQEILRRLPRRPLRQEPDALATARRAKLARLKADAAVLSTESAS